MTLDDVSLVFGRENMVMLGSADHLTHIQTPVVVELEARAAATIPLLVLSVLLRYRFCCAVCCCCS